MSLFPLPPRSSPDRQLHMDRGSVATSIRLYPNQLTTSCPPLPPPAPPPLSPADHAHVAMGAGSHDSFTSTVPR